MTRRQRKAERIYAEWRAKILEVTDQEAMELNARFWRSVSKKAKPYRPIAKYRLKKAKSLLHAIKTETTIGIALSMFMDSEDAGIKLSQQEMVVEWALLVPLRGHRHRKQRERQEAQNG